MKTIFRSASALLSALALANCAPAPTQVGVASPDGSIEAVVEVIEGVPHYRIARNGQALIDSSRLGFAFQDMEPMDGGFQIIETALGGFDEVWEQPWGEKRLIRNNYTEARVLLQEASGDLRRMDVIFRVFNDGVGFRYEIPEQENVGDVVITDELTEFNFSGDHQAWWIPAYEDNRYEYLYQRSPISSLDVVHTPVTFETGDGLVLSLHEAALTDFASMAIRRTEGNSLKCDLVPWSDGTKVKTSAPFKTPWRTLQIGDDDADLIESYLILNLNDPNKLADTSWIEPAKYVGIWWGMHIGKYSWESGDKHGATTENTRKYIDFAAEHGFDGVLVEGWNIGWDGDWMQNSELFRFTEPYPDFDIAELARYAEDKGVELIGHHETSAGIDNYEGQLEAALDFYQELGIEYIKTGYVGTRTNGTEWHHGQYMVRHYRKVVERAAEHKIMLDVHEPIKATGIRRTYPNMMTREGARGQEYNAWSEGGGNPPDHTCILPFTRLLGGPMDFTPGIFDLHFDEYRPHNRVNTTLAKQLALYVVIYSPLHMAADLPENYAESLQAFQFVKDVPVDWDDTRALHAKIGDYVAIARKDRDSPDWYIGAITDEQGRTLEAKLDFLEAGAPYVAEIYADGAEADWESNPYEMEIIQRVVNRDTALRLRLAPGGGQAVRIRPANDEEAQSIPPYGEGE